MESITTRLSDADRLTLRCASREWRQTVDSVGFRSFTRDVMETSKNATNGDEEARKKLNYFQQFRTFVQGLPGPVSERARCWSIENTEYDDLWNRFVSSDFPYFLREAISSYPQKIPYVGLPSEERDYLDNFDLNDFASSVFFGKTENGRVFLGLKVSCHVDFIGKDFKIDDNLCLFIHQRYTGEKTPHVAAQNPRSIVREYLTPEGQGACIDYRSLLYHGEGTYINGIKNLLSTGQLEYNTTYQANRNVKIKLI